MLQFLVESVTLTVAGGAVGMLFARYGVELLKAFGPASIPRLDQASLDWRVLLFSCAVALLTGLLVGAVPAFQVSRRDASLAFSGARATATRHRNLVHNALIGSEIALAVVLLVTAGLLVRSVLALHRVDPGFDPRGVVTGWIMPPGQKYPDAPAQQQFYTRAAANVAAVPDVACAGLVSALPFSGIANDTELRIQSPSGRTSDFRPHAELRVATPGYFCAIGLSMVAGRGFTQRDVLDAPLVALINEEAARRLWPDENPVGRRLSIDRTGEGEVWREIVGVVRSVRHRTLQTTPEPELYLPHTQYSSPIMVAVARTVADPGRAAAPLRAAVADVDADQAVFNVRTMEDLVSSSIAQNRFQALLLAFFGTAALLLSGLGIHGVVSYLLVQRRREFAIRLALGDTPVGLLAHVLRRTLVVAALGSAVGVGLALDGVACHLEPVVRRQPRRRGELCRRVCGGGRVGADGEPPPGAGSQPGVGRVRVAGRLNPMLVDAWLAVPEMAYVDADGRDFLGVVGDAASRPHGCRRLGARGGRPVEPLACRERAP